jgi:hypothetical protein
MHRAAFDQKSLLRVTDSQQRAGMKLITRSLYVLIIGLGFTLRLAETTEA